MPLTTCSGFDFRKERSLSGIGGRPHDDDDDDVDDDDDDDIGQVLVGLELVAPGSTFPLVRPSVDKSVGEERAEKGGGGGGGGGED